MNTSPGYKDRQLGECMARLREIRYSIARLMETQQAAELRLIDELVLLLNQQRVDLVGERPPVQAWMPHKLNGREAM